MRRICGLLFGVIERVLVEACSACAGIICIDVIKRCIAVWIYAVHTYKAVHSGVDICIRKGSRKGSLWGIEFRVQGGGGCEAS